MYYYVIKVTPKTRLPQDVALYILEQVKAEKTEKQILKDTKNSLKLPQARYKIVIGQQASLIALSDLFLQEFSKLDVFTNSVILYDGFEQDHKEEVAAFDSSPSVKQKANQTRETLLSFEVIASMK